MSEHATPGVLMLLLILFGLVFYYTRRELGGTVKKATYIRRLPGVDAIDEAVGRSAEMGRPTVFSTGLTSVGPTLYACLGILSHVARKLASYRTRLIVPQNDPAVLAIAEATVRDAYRMENKSALFDPRDIIFLSDEQFAFAAGYMGLVQREQVASTFLFGVFAAESLILAEAGQQVGAMQIASSVNAEQVPFFICTCDYTLIGEELYGASAYLTREPVQVGSLCAQDRFKLLFFILLLLGVATSTLSSLSQGRLSLPDPVSLLSRGW